MVTTKTATLTSRKSSGLLTSTEAGLPKSAPYRQTPLYRVLEFVRFEAARYGVRVVGTEIIGLSPMMALIDAADYYMQIEKFDAQKQVLENQLL